MSRSASPLLTYEDLVRLPDDGKRHEIVGGRLLVNAVPFLRYQQICRRLPVAFTGRSSRFLDTSKG